MADENAQRALRFLQESEADAAGDKKLSCRWFIDRAFYCVST